MTSQFAPPRRPKARGTRKPPASVATPRPSDTAPAAERPPRPSDSAPGGRRPAAPLRLRPASAAKPPPPTPDAATHEVSDKHFEEGEGDGDRVWG